MRAVASLLILVSAFGVARAEPYLALRSGLSCSSCHVNRTGGGGRTAYGASFGARTLAAVPKDGARVPFDGALHERVRIGSDLRAAYLGHFRGDEAYVGEYRIQEANLYLQVDVLEDRLALYADERFAPGGAANREAFLLVHGFRGGVYAKAGRFFLPYGLRLQDDEAATRRGTGFTFETSDTGIEIGGLASGWSWATSVTNGVGGAAEQDNGKQVVGTVAHVRNDWRLGGSFSTNDLPGKEKHEAYGLFAGARAGPFTVLAAADTLRETDDTGVEQEGESAHVQVDWTPVQGWTIRAWYGAYDRDDPADPEPREQRGIGVDWTPWPSFQLRAFLRDRRGTPVSEIASGDEVAVEVHLFF